jgi:ABC-type antimicrobial peptide transport system permease subunit
VLPLAYFTLRDLLHDRWRSLLTLASLATVVFAYLLLGSLAQAMALFSSRSRINNDLLIVAADTIDPMESTVGEAALQAAVEIAPGEVRRAFPIIFRHLTIDGRITQVRGMMLEELPISQGLSLVEGAWPSGPRQVVAGEGAAHLASWETGSTVNIYGTNFQVSGLVRAGESAFGSIWMSYAEAEQLFGSERGFQAVYLALGPSADAERVRLRLQADERIAGAYTVFHERGYADSYNQSNPGLLVLSGLMVLISLLAVSFGVYNATSLSLAERSREVGLLNVLGFTAGKVRGFLLGRALVLTLAAYGLGWAASRLFVERQQAGASVDLIFLALRLNPLSNLIGLVLAILFASLGVWLTSARSTASNPGARTR